MERILKPITDDKKISLDELHDNNSYYLVKEEIRKLNEINPEKKIDWKKVEEYSYDILENFDKSLQILTYWFIARLYNHGCQTILESYNVLDGFVKEVKVETSKKNEKFFDWWIEKTIDWISKHKEELSRDKASILLKDLEKIQEQFSDSTTQLIPTHRLISCLHSAISENVCDEGSSILGYEPIDVGKKESENSVHYSKESLENNVEKFYYAESHEKLIKTNLNQLKSLSLQIMDNDIFSSKHYRLRRIGVWSDIYLPPTTIEENKTGILPPDINDKRILKTLFDSENWIELIKSSESKLLQYPYWLDLNRFTYIALKKLDHIDIAKQVKRELLKFIDHIESIHLYSFSDGTPFAELDTINWIEKENKYQHKNHLVTEHSESDPTRRLEISKSKSSLYREIYHQVKASLNSGNLELSLCQLELLITAIDTYKLEEWEPMLCIDFLECAAEVYYRTNQRSQYLHVIQKISRIDPTKVRELFRSK
ncbi:TssA family type VI secretion system protein [Grimontia sp. SpTr1]|uniref:TssA family type VI secretion system protein n=1 Tax=Grimontia sp. SpTr1 TaxID=2995319 RepID=UPI00248D2E88|nr:TssA family type VI secretion system protein [Grimontia sp. SpTr1]